MVPYDLRRESWIPFRRLNGQIQWGPPFLLTDDIDDNPIVALAAPRPDFDGALLEFLIGLLTVALQPEDEDAWQAWWHAPCSPDEMRRRLEALPAAFDLDGDGPRFFQDLSISDLATAPVAGIEQLLIDAPGDQTARLNKDLFVKRDRIEALGPPAAAMALLTIQTYAPSGGQGHRTSLRGGGPLTTIIDPRAGHAGAAEKHDQALWRLLWANVESREQWARRAPETAGTSPADVFPWLAPTRASTKAGHTTSPAEVHPLQAYFGLPRRIRLEFAPAGRCDLTGEQFDRRVTGFRMRNYGVQYINWRHPLSPYYLAASGDWLPVHGQRGGVGWKDWVGVTLTAPVPGKRDPATAVAHFLHLRAGSLQLRTARVRAFGYDMDNMKARGWSEAALPAFATTDPERARLAWDAADRMTNAGGITATALLSAVEQALFRRPDDAPGDQSAVKAELWDATADAFYAAMRRAANPATPAESVDLVCVEFCSALESAAMAAFDRRCDSDSVPPELVRRLVTARFGLLMTLRGYSKLGQKLFDSLRIPRPAGGRGTRTSKGRKGTAA